jgi:hypothetical protein
MTAHHGQQRLAIDRAQRVLEDLVDDLQLLRANICGDQTLGAPILEVILDNICSITYKRNEPIQDYR